MKEKKNIPKRTNSTLNEKAKDSDPIAFLTDVIHTRILAMNDKE